MNKQNLTVPIAIIITGIIIGGAIYLSKDNKNNINNSNNVNTDVPNFAKCLNDEKYKQKVEDNLQDGIKAGVKGTPHSIIINEKGDKYTVGGALPYELIQPNLDKIIAGQEPDSKYFVKENDTSVSINDGDHVLGNPNALVTIIEFSDTECPFCKKFHETMRKIIDEYGKDGKVKWVYRHFPLDQIHSKSRKEAEATECATEQGGNEKFWEFINKIYEITPSNNGLDPAELPKIAKSIGLN